MITFQAEINIVDIGSGNLRRRNAQKRLIGNHILYDVSHIAFILYPI